MDFIKKILFIGGLMMALPFFVSAAVLLETGHNSNHAAMSVGQGITQDFNCADIDGTVETITVRLSSSNVGNKYSIGFNGETGDQGSIATVETSYVITPFTSSDWGECTTGTSTLSLTRVAPDDGGTVRVYGNFHDIYLPSACVGAQCPPATDIYVLFEGTPTPPPPTPPVEVFLSDVEQVNSQVEQVLCITIGATSTCDYLYSTSTIPFDIQSTFYLTIIMAIFFGGAFAIIKELT